MKKWGLLFDIDGQKQEIEVLQKKTLEENFWNDRQEAQKILKNISDLQESVNRFCHLWEEANYIKDILDMAQEEDDQELWSETATELKGLQKRFREFELLVLFSGIHDERDAILSLHAGAGGTETQN